MGACRASSGRLRPSRFGVAMNYDRSTRRRASFHAIIPPTMFIGRRKPIDARSVAARADRPPVIERGSVPMTDREVMTDREIAADAPLVDRRQAERRRIDRMSTDI